MMTDHVGTRFAQALADKDAAELKALLRPDVDFRAMTPGRFWESNDVDEIVDQTILGTWFDPERQITELVNVDTDSIGSVERVGYRFTVVRPDGDFTIEQQAYYQTDGATIAWLRIMCSGFLPLGRHNH
jgi:ketosteroid isomerase-like protein